LENLTSIKGILSFKYNIKLTSLTELDNVTSIGGGLHIRGHHLLTNLTGLNNVTSIEGLFYIDINNSLTSFAGLENLSSIGGDLIINSNDALASLTGLDNIEASSIANLNIRNNSSLSTCDVQSICDYIVSPGGTIEIYNNASGCNNPPEVANACGFILPCLPNGDYYFFSQADIDNFQSNYPGCTQLEGSVQISGSDITDLNGLNEVISIEENLNFYNNDALTSLTGLDNLDSIGGNLNIGDEDNGGNSALTSLTGLDKLTFIGGLRIDGNYSLTSLTGLDNVTSIEGDLVIGVSWDGYGNPALTSLTGLNNLTSIGGHLEINRNDVLTSLSGLDNIEASSIGNLSIRNNSSLSTCEVQSICDYLISLGGWSDIHDNAPGCNSQEEVEEACESVSVNEETFNTYLSIYPNPAQLELNISTEGYIIEEVSIYTLTGQQVLQERPVIGTIDISHLPPGMYIVEVTIENTRIRQKLLVE